MAHAQDEPTDSRTARPVATAEGESDKSSEDGKEIDPEISDIARKEEAALNEDPEAQRRTQIEEQPDLREDWPTFEIYGSLRVHLINHFDESLNVTEVRLGDGASRAGVRGEWKISEKWALFGRAEAGFDVLESFTPKAGNLVEDESTIFQRLLYGGVDSDHFTGTLGKNWSAYYKVAGITDRYSIFGGNGVGVNNAGTDGGATGTGRADDALQARIYMDLLRDFDVKPFNLNLQYQRDQPIPHADGARYGDAWSASAWLEWEADWGLGLAYHQAAVDDLDNTGVQLAGIDGDARVAAMGFRMYGADWYGAFVVADMENIETNDLLQYVNARGAELYVQWQAKDNWWLITGGNWLEPDEDDPDAGEYEVLYAVLGIRYTFDSFNRMLYFEYRLDEGTLYDGTPRKDELTFGIRWDFGY